MTSRSSRLFVVLLHLIGNHHYTGIVSVHPWPHLALEEVHELHRLNNNKKDNTIWLQTTDSNDECLGPTGTLTACGDATLWNVQALPSGLEEDDDGFALCVASDAVVRQRWWWWRRRKSGTQPECLRRKGSALVLGPRPGVWRLRADGALQLGDKCLVPSDDEANELKLGSCQQQPLFFRALRYRAQSAQVEPQQPQTTLTNNTTLPTRRRPERTKKQLTPLPILEEASPALFFTQQRPSINKLAHPTETLQSSTRPGAVGSSMHTGRRMQTHPYIVASHNNLWTDPQTGLQYRTDLCEYLGQNRQEKGRHTLAGVGQYRKFVVKVYGIAYYVSKRDVLSDPVFEQYAGLTADELRQRPDFYEELRHMQSPEQPHRGAFERTLIIKTNMQLAADTIRSSLKADWKMLSEEAIDTLISSSLQPRPADDTMLNIISSPDNPSRCSCSQVAPPEYEADLQCCARGTELAFTWIKSGELEVRLNGKLMEVFPRPDIAAGIFFEYLRTDDPMSTEFIANVVDGFPFLLGPLAQIKGISMGPPVSAKATTPNPVVAAAGALWNQATAGAEGLSHMAQHALSDAQHHASNAVNAAGEAANSFLKEAERRRILFLKHATSFRETMVKIAANEQDPIQTVSEWMMVSNVTPGEEADSRKPAQGRVFGYPLSRWFNEVYYAPDEIGPMVIQPTLDATRKIFLALVHLYLLLIFIVSFPGSYTTRTKLLIRKGELRQASDSESDSDEERQRRDVRQPVRLVHGILKPTTNEDCVEVLVSPLKKKSLSYYL